MSETVRFIDADERIKRFGIECVGPLGDGISFLAGQWRPGGEYVQKLTIRNVSTIVKKVKYRLPSTRYFSMAFPEVIILSPGMYKEIDVIFRPVELEAYDDAIYIRMQEAEGNEGFYVPVRAHIVKLQLETPFGIDLGYCATNQVTGNSFYLTNIGEVDAPFSWQSPFPFFLEPMQGIVPVGKKQEIKVTINPSDASVYVGQAVCKVGNDVHANIPEPIITTRLSAIGKYAYIVLSEFLLDFGEVVSGTSSDLLTREVMLRNNGLVPAEFSCFREENDRDEVFDIYPRSGIVPPQGELAVKVKFHALAFGSYSFEQYSFRTPGGCTTTLSLKAQVMPVNVIARKEVRGTTSTLSSTPLNSINFGDVEIGSVQTRILFLKNDSAVEASFDVLCNAEGTFKVEPSQGTIPAEMETHLKLTFVPTRPINYYRRIFILLSDSLPLFFDAYGSGFIRARGEIKEQRPLPLRHAHIQAFRNRSVQGLGRLNPDELDSIVARDGLSDLFAVPGRNGTMAMSVTSLKNPVSRTGEASRIALAVAHELFINDNDPSSREVTIDRNDIDFGYTPHGSTSEFRTVTVTNHTSGKMMISWYCPCITSNANEIQRSVLASGNTNQNIGDVNAAAFDVVPPVADLNPESSVTFKIYFRPLQSTRNYVSELEAFVFFKNQRTFRLVNDATLTPPWCIPVQVVGHTFSSGQLLATAKLSGGSIRNGKILFPCCYLGDALFQCVRLRNVSNLPSTFKFSLGWDDDVSDRMGSGSNRANQNAVIDRMDTTVFSIKPMSGEVAAHGFRLICIRFQPNQNKKYLQLLKCIINGSIGTNILLEGTASLPSLKFPALDPPPVGSSAISKAISIVSGPPSGFQGSYYLKPTFIGLTSTSSFILKNSSRLPLRFKLTLPAAAAGIIVIKPMSGLIRGNETMSLTVTFAPRKQKTYTFRLHAKTYPIGGPPPKVTDARQPGNVGPVEPLQSLSANIIGEGEMGAVTFEPSRISTGVHLVNTSEIMTMCLENISDADLCYSLFYRMEFNAEGSSTANSNNNISHISTEFQPIQQSSMGKNVSNNGQYLLCDQPKGHLPARSKTKVEFLFCPSRAGLFEFMVMSHIHAVDAEGNPITLSNEEAALLKAAKVDLSNDANNVLEQLQQQRNNNDNNNQNELGGTSSSTVGFLPLMANITGRASFPTMIIKDIRTENDTLISNIDQLWKQFSLSSLNYELGRPLSDEEVHFNQLSSPDMTKLKRYPFIFTPDILGAPKNVVTLLLHNNGFLPTSFRLHMPNEKELDLEPWCDEDELSEEILTQINILEEIKCFLIEPRRGILQPGESLPITFAYSYTSLRYGGIHKLPILLKVHQGKQLWIDILGRTLGATSSTSFPNELPPVSILSDASAPTTVLLFPCTGPDNTYTLAPIPIGLRKPDVPIQRIEIVNVSSVEITYEVDTATVRHLSHANLGMNILSIVNPKGDIPPRSSVFLEWIFNPLESKSYEIPLIIRYYKAGMNVPLKQIKATTSRAKQNILLNAQFLELILKATGYDPRLGITVPPTNITFSGSSPLQNQMIKYKNSIAELSTDILDFNIIPQCCKASRMLILRNISSTSQVEFIVEDSMILSKEAELLQVTPLSGRLSPGEHVVIHVTVYAIVSPVVFNDRLKISVREVIKAAKANNNSLRQAKILDRIKSLKVWKIFYRMELH